MNKILFPRKSLLLIALLLFIGCASNLSFNTNRNKQIDISVELINKVYSLIIRYYYKPVSVSSMLFGSIKGMENLVGDTGFLIIEDGHPKMFNPRIHETMDQEELDQKITPYEGLGIFEEIYLLTIENKPDYSPESIAYAALDGLAQSLDPHSALLPPEAFDDLDKDSKPKNTGIGIHIQMKDGFVTVISAIDNTPAMRSGIRAGDRIIIIDGEPVINLWQAVKLLRGPKGTKVMISIMRAGNIEPLDFVMVRDVLPPVKIRAIPLVPGYGYVRLSSFPGGTATQLEKILGELENWKDPLQGLILDLRGNGGGLVKEAIKVSDLFLEECKIVTIVGKTKRNTKEYASTPNSIKRNYSMVVLINEGSAAASEIVAGALQDNKRAFILGTKSFGRGSIQTMETLPGGYKLKLTIALCYTPSGRSIQDEAIEPDMVVKRNFVSDKDYFYIDHPLLTKEGPEDLLSIEIKIEADNQVKRALEFLIQNNQSKLDV